MDEIIWQWGFQVLCYPLGWPLMKLLTLGRRPAPASWFADSLEARHTALLGLAVWASLLTLAVWVQLD